MSKKNTIKDKIVEKSLKLFNEHGVDNVSMREIAAETGMLVGNLTYYYPRKEDILLGIYEKLSETNSAIIQKMEESCDITAYLTVYKKVYENQYNFRSVLYQTMEMFNRLPELESNYKINLRKRIDSIKQHVRYLELNGYIKLDINLFNHVSNMLVMVGRLWTFESKLRFPNATQNELVNHYVTRMAYILMPYATKKGEKQLVEFIEKYPDVLG